jgi:polyhydroxybutyrate depolymerase
MQRSVSAGLLVAASCALRLALTAASAAALVGCLVGCKAAAPEGADGCMVTQDCPPPQICGPENLCRMPEPGWATAGNQGASMTSPGQAGAPGATGAVAGRTAGAAAISGGSAAGRAAAAGATPSQSPAQAGGSGVGAIPSAGMSAAVSGSGGGGGGVTSGPSAPPVCPATLGYEAGPNSVMIQHGGRMRRFSVNVPSSVKADVPVPLVLDFHGNGSSGSQEEGGSGWRAKGDSEGFVTAFPDGIGNGWNVGNCCGEALMSMVDDVGFAREMVKTISAAVCIDPKRVYATGISNGAGLAHRLACEAADVFAAIAAASADLVTDPCTPARPISELSVRGLTDTLVAYEGGNTGSTGWYSPGAKGTLMLWKDINGCTGAVDTSKEYCETYSNCQGGTEVTLCSLPNTGHILYNNSLGFNVPDEAWEMFKRQPMK